MTGIIKVDTIQNNGGTTGLTINSSGVIKPSHSGAVIAMRHYSNSTRTAVSNSNDGTLWTFTDAKLLGTETDIIVYVNLIGKDDASGVMGTYIEYGGSRSYSISYTYEPTDYNKMMTGSSKATGIGSGNNTVTIGWNTANSSNSKPFQVLNPNGTDDSRSHQHVSTAIVYEVMA